MKGPSKLPGAGVAVRPRADSDLPACVRVLAAVQERDGYPSRWPRDATGWLSPDGMVGAWVAESDRIVRGHVALVAGVEARQLRSAVDGLAEPLAVTRLFVDPALRGRGIGELLLRTATGHATGRGAGLVLDVVDSRDSPAIALYERLGWRLVGHRRAGWVTADGEHPLLRLYAWTDGTSPADQPREGEASRLDERHRVSMAKMTASLDEADRPALLAALEYQRSSVRAIVDGLSEEHWHTSVVPSGWTPAGLVAHLGGAERHWTCGVILDHDPGHRFDEDVDDGEPYDPDAPFVIAWSSEKVLAYYRDQTQQTDDMLGVTPLDSAPRGRHGPAATDTPGSVREIVLHLIEETAAHSGHLEIARELLDGKTRLGLR